MMSSKLFTALFLILVSPYFLERSFSLEIHVDVTGDDNLSCLNGTFACKTLQYVLNWLSDFNNTDFNSTFPAVHIYIHYDQTIRDEEETIYIKIFDYNELSITGVETAGIPICIQAQNLSGGIEFWSDSEYVLMNDFIDTTTVRLSNLNFVDLPIRFTNLSQVYLNQSVFLADCELDDDTFDPQSSAESAANSSGLLNINGVLNVSINEVDFSNYSTVVIIDASNILVINTTFTQTKISCTTTGNGTDWSFMHSTFQEDTINGSNLLTLCGAVNSISIVHNSFINNSNHYGLILLSSIGSVGSFEFHNNNIENNSVDLPHHYSIDLYGSSDNCQVVSNISFYDNTFSENSGKRCLIGIDTCCRTQNKYHANHFLNNKVANMNIKSGNKSIHTLSNTTFDSNIAINTLVTFGIAEPCEDSATKYTILAEDLEFTENSFYVTVQEDLQDPSAMTIGSENNDKSPILLSMGSLKFYKNYGTALTLFNVNITQLLGDLNFTLNTGNFGGGMLLYKIYMSRSSIESEINMTFANNTAKFGGAVYIMDSPCFLNESKNCMIRGEFTGNKASVEGDTIYSQLSHCCEPMSTCNFIFDTNTTSDHPPIVSKPDTITISADEKDIDSNKSLAAFAGRNVELQFSLKDCQGTPVMCTAKALALCGEDNSKPYSCAGHKDGFKFELDGPVYVKLQSGFVNTESNLSISKGINDDMLRQIFQGLNPKLYFQCRNHRGYDLVSMTKSIAVQLEDCPKGYNYQDTDGFCECSAKNTSKYFCDFKSGTICVKKGYWIGYETSGNSSSPLIVTKCTSLNCYFNNTNNCSRLDHLTDYVHVNLEEDAMLFNEDSRCIRRHSGFLCSECMDNTSNSFDTYYCIEDSKCKEWHKPVLLIFSIMWPIVYGFFLLFMVPRTENGVGSFFCPFFFLAVLGSIVKEDSFDDYNELQVFASILVSTFLLGSRALGLIKWCFFSMGGPMWIWFYNYSGPVIIFMFLIMIVFLANRCSKRFLRLQSNPVMSMCIALVVTFWSLAFTSITLITPLQIDGLESGAFRLEVQPTQLYLKELDWYVFIFIVSVIILMCLTFVALLLLFSPFVLGYLTKIKPFLDEFHHCYKIKYRWFSGLYFLSWIILSACKVSQQQVVFTSILFGLLFLHCMCQPYRRDWMNKSDSFFLIDLVMIVSIDVVKSNGPHWLYDVLKYITVLLPLLYIAICCLYMVGKIFISFCQFIRKFLPKSKQHIQISSNDSTSISVHVIDHRARTTALSSFSEGDNDFIKTSEASLEREPLLFNTTKSVRQSEL